MGQKCVKETSKTTQTARRHCHDDKTTIAKNKSGNWRRLGRLKRERWGASRYNCRNQNNTEQESTPSQQSAQIHGPHWMASIDELDIHLLEPSTLPGRKQAVIFECSDFYLRQPRGKPAGCRNTQSIPLANCRADDTSQASFRTSAAPSLRLASP